MVHVNYFLKRDYLIIETMNHKKIVIPVSDDNKELFLTERSLGLTLLEAVQFFSLTLKGQDHREAC